MSGLEGTYCKYIAMLTVKIYVCPESDLHDSSIIQILVGTRYLLLTLIISSSVSSADYGPKRLNRAFFLKFLKLGTNEVEGNTEILKHSANLNFSFKADGGHFKMAALK